jgi:hypothetical protein
VAIGPKVSKPVGQGITLETEGDRKRILIDSRVCLREIKQIGLECLLCRSLKKEHESILATDADAEEIHIALENLGAKAGSPPTYQPLETPAGVPSQVVLKYEQAGKSFAVPTKWSAPADTPVRLWVEYTQGESVQYVPPTMEAPGGVTLRAQLEYTKNGEFSDLPKVEFQAPAGPPIKLGLEFQQGDKVTTAPPLYTLATGTPIKVSLQYELDGKRTVVPASKWILNGRTKKELEHDFVFAGSVRAKNPLDPDAPPTYLASAEGAYLSVCDVPTTLLSLPVWSPKGQNDRFFAPYTERIPPEGTRVTVILEPVLEIK